MVVFRSDVSNNANLLGIVIASIAGSSLGPPYLPVHLGPLFV